MNQELAREAKAIVAIAFRNGPIEAIHAGRACPFCRGRSEVSHITDPEMAQIMRVAVDRVYAHLEQRDNDPEGWERTVAFGEQFTTGWDDPVVLEDEA